MNAADTFKCKKMRISMYVGKCIRNQKEALDFWGPEAGRFQSCPCDQGISIKTQMEGDMAKKGTCGNCLRADMTIHSAGMCGGCVRRAIGLEGEAREAALAQAKSDFFGKGNQVRKRSEAVKAKVRARRARLDKKAKVELAVNPDPESGAIANLAILQEGDGVFAEGQTKALGKGLSNEKTDTSTTVIYINAVDAKSFKDLCKSNPNGIVGLATQALPDNSILVCFNNGDEALLESLNDIARKCRRDPDQQILWMLERELSSGRLLDEVVGGQKWLKS